MVQMQQRDVAPAAQPSRVGGVGGVALYLENLPLLHIGKNTAILMTEVTGGFLDLDPRSMDVYGLCHVPLLSLCNEAPLQRVVLQSDASMARRSPIVLSQTQLFGETYQKSRIPEIAKAILCSKAYYGEWCHTWRMILARIGQRSAE
jgi:hypothetical protein